MQMTRRGLLGMFAATAILDSERLLWVRGAKTISIPKPTVIKLKVKRLLIDGKVFSLDKFSEELQAAFPAIGMAAYEGMLSQMKVEVETCK